MQNENKLSTWTDTRGVADHFNIKPATIRKHRSKQMKNTLPFHKVGGAIKYNIVECEKFMERNKNAF